MEADGIGGGRRGGYTLNEPKKYEISTVRSAERRKASGIGGGSQKEDTHQTGIQSTPKTKKLYHHDSVAAT